METMTAMQAWQLSGDADVYVQGEDGEAFLIGGCRTCSGLALSVDPGDGSRRSWCPQPSDIVAVRVVR